MVYNAKEGESIYDMAARLYGDTPLGIERILTLNPNLDLDDVSYFGTEITFDNSTRVKPVIINPQSEVTTFTYSTRELQSAYDLAVQLTGSLNGLKDILLGVTDLDNSIPVTTSFNLPISIDPIATYFSERKLVSSTDIKVIGMIGDFRLLEDGDFRLLEDNDFRLLE